MHSKRKVPLFGSPRLIHWDRFFVPFASERGS